MLGGIQTILEACLDTKKLVRLVNAELDQTWAEEGQKERERKRAQAEIEAKIANIRQAIEDGLSDAAWANQRLEDLKKEKEALGSSGSERPPRVDEEAIASHIRQLSRLLGGATPRERKELIGLMVEGIKLAPEQRSVEIVYRAPEPLMHKVVAGVGFEPTTFGL